MFYPRRILTKIRKYLNAREIIVLTGMRRVGKTTLYRLLFEEIKSKNKIFLDLENPLNQKIFEETNYDNVWLNLQRLNLNPKEKAWIFLDEIGAMPQIVKVIKYLFDHYEIKFFLTGSTSFYLKNLFPESLAGRKITFELFPLDFEEFLIFKGIKQNFSQSFKQKDKEKNLITYERLIKLYEEYLEYGGFPQVVLAPQPQLKKLALEDILKSYFEKDVQGLADFKNLSAFRDLLLLLLARTGAKIDISKLASEIGVSRPTVQEYLSFLRQTYFLDLVPAYSKSPDRQASKAKKLYICDTGFINCFTKVEGGRLFENSVYLNLKKYGKISYFQKWSGTEIDFILEDKGIALEVKENALPQDYNRLKRISSGLRLKEFYVVTKRFVGKRGFIPAVLI
jgi:predicted AAA+ superfamily ATPase